jgi:vacuolar-type H+-ATPase subunit E/Vma4
VTRTHDHLDAELAPVRDALLRMARADAAAVLAEADQEVAEQRAQTDARARELVEEARAQGAADAAVLADAERSRLLRETRSVELRAHRAAYDALVAAAADVVRVEVATDPDVVAAMTDRARRELGPDAVVTPAPDGGLVATAGGRRLGLPLGALVERAVADLLTSEEAS